MYYFHVSSLHTCSSCAFVLQNPNSHSVNYVRKFKNLNECPQKLLIERYNRITDVIQGAINKRNVFTSSSNNEINRKCTL